jgi:hypothetical protein
MMKSTRQNPRRRILHRRLAAGLSGLAVLAAVAPSGPAQDTVTSPRLLWQIGKPDNDDREFALAPNRYRQFREDGFFVVGRSDPKRDWPYVHPGPADDWAGGRQHTFTIVFGLRAAPMSGECALRFDFVDTQGQVPPALRIQVNGREFRHQPPPGAGDASVFGEPARGKEHKFDLPFPANLLKAGANEIAITTRSGSWVLYDWIGLETPAGLELADVTGVAFLSADSPPVLEERDGKLRQVLRVAMTYFGDAAVGRIRVSTGPTHTVQSVPLRSGRSTCDVLLDPVPTNTPARLALHPDLESDTTLATAATTLKPVRKWVVYLLPHSHVDIGYTHVQTDVEKAQWKYLEMAMDAARRSATNPPGSRFKWNVEVLWAVDSYLKQAAPEKRRQFIEAVKAGQVGLQALYGNELTGLCRPEELLRLLSCAQRLARLCETPVSSAMITDVPGYTWGVVPAFAHSGVKYFSIGPNGGDRIGHTIAAWGDKPFWWLGPNGRDRVLVWMTGTGYYRVFSSAQNLLNYLGRLDESGYPYDFVQVRHCLGDNGAPDVNFADTVRQWNETHAYPRLVIATTDEMFRDFEQRYGAQLPTARGDFTPYWEDGAASSALETAMNRASADRLVQAETLFALFNPKAYPAAEFQQAWRNVLLYDEHTWGAHNSISQPDHPFVQSQWAIKRQFAVDADAQSRGLLAAANEARGPAVPSAAVGGEPTAPAPPGQVQAIDVVNTTGCAYPWTLVTVPRELSRAGDRISYTDTNLGSGVSQRLTTGELVFRPCVGGFTSHRWHVSADTPAAPRDAFPAARAQGTTLTVARSAIARAVTLRLDEKTGGIASLIYDDRELVDTHAPTGLNDYFYLPGSDLKKLQRNGPPRISVKERGPLIASLLVESDAPGCRKLTREYRLHALRNYVEIINTVDKAPVRAKEGVHFGFGFNVPNAVVRMDVPWAVVRPEEDQIPGACKNWFTVQRYVDVSNQDFGVTWLTPDAPLVQIGGLTANLIGSMALRDWITRLEPSQAVYSWAMNNHWHTNYRAEQEGPTVFRYFVIPHASAEPDFPARVALEMAQPPLVLPARGEGPPSAPRPEVGGRRGAGRAQVTAFKPSDDGAAWIVRLFGVSGEPEQVTLKWTPPEPRTVWLSDNSEKPLAPAGETVEVPPLSIVTLRAELP